MKITAKYEIEEEDLIGKIQSSISEALEIIGNHQAANIRKSFDLSEDRNGNAWQLVAPRHVADRRKVVPYNQHKPLKDTGALQRSIDNLGVFKKKEGQQLRVGTQLPYARQHDQGAANVQWTGHQTGTKYEHALPKREFMHWTEDEIEKSEEIFIELMKAAFNE